MNVTKWFTMSVMAMTMAAGTASAQQPATGLQDLVGAKGRDGEYQLQQRGYEHIRTEKSGDSAYSYWQETENGQCVTVRTTDGRYASIVYAPMSDCQGGGASSHGGGDSDRQDKFESVCGVIVDGQNYRYRCRVVNFYQGGQIVKTALHYPDINMRLVWKSGDQAVVHMEGTKPYHVSYSTSEGETNFQMDGKTYFYISDKGMADMEVRNFQD